MRQTDADNLTPTLLESLDPALDCRANLPIKTVAEVLLGHTDTQSIDRIPECAGVVVHRTIRAGCIQWVFAGKHAQHRRRIGYVGRKRSHMVERRSERDQPKTADAA